MSESSPIKDALYAEIDRIGQDKINKLLIKKEFVLEHVENISSDKRGERRYAFVE